jgi:hypothetical protein
MKHTYNVSIQIGITRTFQVEAASPWQAAAMTSELEYAGADPVREDVTESIQQPIMTRTTSSKKRE